MQQLKEVESYPPQDGRVSSSLVQRILGLGLQTLPSQPSNADTFEDSKLDERVRESGEW